MGVSIGLPATLADPPTHRIVGPKRSDVDPPRSSRRACLHAAFIAFAVPFVSNVAGTVPFQCAAPLTPLNRTKGRQVVCGSGGGAGGHIGLPPPLRIDKTIPAAPQASQRASAHGQSWRSAKLSNPPTHPQQLSWLQGPMWPPPRPRPAGGGGAYKAHRLLAAPREQRGLMRPSLKGGDLAQGLSIERGGGVSPLRVTVGPANHVCLPPRALHLVCIRQELPPVRVYNRW